MKKQKRAEEFSKREKKGEKNFHLVKCKRNKRHDKGHRGGDNLTPASPEREKKTLRGMGNAGFGGEGVAESITGRKVGRNRTNAVRDYEKTGKGRDI